MSNSSEPGLGVSRTSYFSSFFHFPEEPAGSFRGPQESPHGSQRVHVFEIFQVFPGSSRVVRVVIVYRPSPRPPGVLSEFAGLLPEFSKLRFLRFPGFAGFFQGCQGCHSLQAFSGAPRKSSQAFSGAPRRVVRVHRRFQGRPERLSEFAGGLRCSQEFPPEAPGSHPGFSDFPGCSSRLSKFTGLLGAQEFPGSSGGSQVGKSPRNFKGLRA